jgi:hypothetical protein
VHAGHRVATVEDAHAVAEVAAAVASAGSGAWHAVPAVPGASYAGPGTS